MPYFSNSVGHVCDDGGGGGHACDSTDHFVCVMAMFNDSAGHVYDSPGQLMVLIMFAIHYLTSNCYRLPARDYISLSNRYHRQLLLILFDCFGRFLVTQARMIIL